jgi:hypothetical protein
MDRMVTDICRTIGIWDVVYAGFENRSHHFNFRDERTGFNGDNEVNEAVMKIKITKVFLVLSFLTFTSIVSFSQPKSKITPSVQLQYFKDNDDKSYLKTTLTYSKNRMELPLKSMKIEFYSGTGKKETLAESLTDEKGVAVYNLKHDSDLSADKNGLWPFSTVFSGNDTVESGSAELLIRNVKLNMTLTEVDSIKTISVTAEKFQSGRMVPVSSEKLPVYVPRMFSLLPIGEITLDETGKGSVEFPADLPGDKNGNITIICRFEEHPEFGNVETRKSLEWGVPATSSTHSSHRALWTKTAPKWMIYTLSILLTGVWGHYLFAIISLIRIRIDAKRKEEEDNYGKVIKV